MIMGMMNIGMPMYDAMKFDVFQFPSRNTSKPATRVMMAAPMNPYHAVNGWNGDFQGSVSLSTPWALSAAWKRM